MLVFDFIHDESPLFAESLNYLIENNQLNLNDFSIVTMGKRWYQFFYDFKNISFTEFCESLDKKVVDIDMFWGNRFTRLAPQKMGIGKSYQKRL